MSLMSGGRSGADPGPIQGRFGAAPRDTDNYRSRPVWPARASAPEGRPHDRMFAWRRSQVAGIANKKTHTAGRDAHCRARCRTRGSAARRCRRRLRPRGEGVRIAETAARPAPPGGARRVRARRSRCPSGREGAPGAAERVVATAVGLTTPCMGNGHSVGAAAMRWPLRGLWPLRDGWAAAMRCSQGLRRPHGGDPFGCGDARRRSCPPAARRARRRGGSMRRTRDSRPRP